MPVSYTHLGVIWGLWHAPLTIIGHNYGVGYPGWPFAGIAAMCVFCTALGIFLTYVTVRTGSCLAAAVGHGAINAFVSAGIMFSLTGGNPFVGPMPVGLSLIHIWNAISRSTSLNARKWIS